MYILYYIYYNTMLYMIYNIHNILYILGDEMKSNSKRTDSNEQREFSLPFQ